MDGGVDQARAPALGRLAVARMLFDVGNQPRVEDRLAIRLGIKTTIEVEVGSVEIDTHLFGHLFQRFQGLLMVMTLALLVYSVAQRRLRQAFARQNETIPNQINQPTNRPTLRWVFQVLEGIERVSVRIEGKVK